MPQAVARDGKIVGNVSSNAGNHLVVALVEIGNVQQWRMYKLHVTDPPAEALRQAKLIDKAPSSAQWECLDLGILLNGDIRTIYQQQYLSPRPNTCSMRLSVDGYRTWMMQRPDLGPPPIDLCNVQAMLKSPDRLVSQQGVPFRWTDAKNNICFTSQWDNWPKSITVPIRKKGEALWFLVCGSTSPMQTRIANAELRMKYADGVVEKLELVPPLNYWNLCKIYNTDYDYGGMAFPLPKTAPQTVQLGNNCRAMLLNWRLRKDVELKDITLETLSQEVVVGLMGLTLMNPEK